MCVLVEVIVLMWDRAKRKLSSKDVVDPGKGGAKNDVRAFSRLSLFYRCVYSCTIIFDTAEQSYRITERQIARSVPADTA